MDPQRQVISNRLRRLREERGLTQEAVARQADISWRHYQLLEQGGSTPRWSTLEKLAAAYGVDPLEITGDKRNGRKAQPDKAEVAKLQLRLHDLEKKLNTLTKKIGTMERAS